MKPFESSTRSLLKRLGVVPLLCLLGAGLAFDCEGQFGRKGGNVSGDDEGNSGDPDSDESPARERPADKDGGDDSTTKDPGATDGGDLPDPSADRLIVYYGYMADFGGVPQAVETLSTADLVVLAHVAKDGVNVSLPNPTGCADVTVDPDLPSTIAALKAKKPGIKIFGNVYGALDASSEWGCGQTPPKALVQQWAEIKDESELSGMPEADWSCPGGICSNFVTYVEKWIEAGATGVAIEFAGPIYMNQTALISEVSYIRNRGLDVMLNVPIARKDFMLWAVRTPGLEEGDYLALEGFYSMAGADVSGRSRDLIDQYLPYREQGIKIAALATADTIKVGSGGTTFGFSWDLFNKDQNLYKGIKANCADELAKGAYQEFKRAWTPGSVFQYTTLEFGFATRVLQNCPRTGW